ncbi:DUF4157 domain-containing protein [Frankia sp. QA3]|uniref:eCIS core domain-containing protein n=1 Tax=Frankia sp. QA3 TaxID=710111 RepID=UPI00031675E2|nr:DUF4157 domain-containing protein [Frankia sp. QA3]
MAALLNLQRSAGNVAVAVTLHRFGGLFGTDFSGVRLVADSTLAGGNAHAVTHGEQVHFAPGRYAPGTAAGDRLIAHELAHVVQQRRATAGATESAGGTDRRGSTGPVGAGGAVRRAAAGAGSAVTSIVPSDIAAEVDADIAADAAVRGLPARPAQTLPAGTPRRYEAWEHRQLGDAHGGDGRRVRLPNGVELTYGQIVALSGDFYRSPEALLQAPASELRSVLDVMERERRQAAAHPDPAAPGGVAYAPTQDQVNQNNADYEMATTGHDRVGLPVAPLAGDADAADGRHGAVSGGEHVESDAPDAQAGFLDLAAENAAHFSPENIRQNWIPKHQLALDLAREAWQARHPGAPPAAISGGEAASVRAGLPAGSAAARPALPPTEAAAAAAAPGRPDPALSATPGGVADAGSTAGAGERFEAQAWLASAFSDHFLTDAFAAGHLISGSAGRTICAEFFTRNRAHIYDACARCAYADGRLPYNVVTAPSGAILAATIFGPLLRDTAASLLLKTVHDHYNAHGIEVRNALGQQWRTFGDARLGGHPETERLAELASKASRDAVADVLATGGTSRGSAALDYLPDLARIGTGPYLGIAEFASDPAGWDPVLAHALSPDPSVNGLYSMIKGNIVPMAGMLGRKGERAVESARQRVTAIPEDIGRWFDTLSRDIERLYGAP